ncbi:beta-xylosidase [Vibrio astriarenae]|nr:beta-xylosidase [Vibrio sp. C7]
MHLAAGETKRVVFELPVDMLNFTNAKHQRVVEGGDFNLMLGRSSNEIEFTQTVTVEKGTFVLPKNWRMVCNAYSE